MTRQFRHLCDLEQLAEIDPCGFELTSYGTDKDGNLIFNFEGFDNEHFDIALHGEIAVTDIY